MLSYFVIQLGLLFLLLASGESEASINNNNNNDFGDLGLYKIVWKGPLTGKEKFKEDNVIDISTKYKERYKCVVPNDDSDMDDGGQLNFDSSARNSSSETDQSKTPIQVLEPLLKSNYCSYKFELFWVYELCHGKFLRQYHEENAKFKSKITQEYYLGRAESVDESLKKHEEMYEKEKQELEKTGLSRPTILINDQYKPYVMFNMSGGTKCDLTKNNRVARIVYVCNEEPKHELYSIKEISTCEYEAIVLSPLLCQHKDFKGDTNVEQEIKCYSIDGAPKKPKNLIEASDEEEKMNQRRRGIAYFQGRTVTIYDADFILS